MMVTEWDAEVLGAGDVFWGERPCSRASSSPRPYLPRGLNGRLESPSRLRNGDIGMTSRRYRHVSIISLRILHNSSRSDLLFPSL